jgi:hypothetical protein
VYEMVGAFGGDVSLIYSVIKLKVKFI